MASNIAYTIQQNQFGDALAIIPSESSVQSGSILYRLDLEMAVTRNDAPASGLTIGFRVSGVQSHARQIGPTGAGGKATLRLESRIVGKNTITPLGLPEFADCKFDVTLGAAWFESPFKITAYNCCDEADFSGPLVNGQNVGKHKQDFLFGGRGICMQGTGRGSDGKYITITNPKSVSWNPGYAGVANPDAVIFQYSDGVHGAYGLVTADSSIAIDPTILPPRHRVNIIGPRALGERRGDDTGGAIKGHHFDHYVGAGQAAVDAWNAAGGNLASAKVKYLGS
jgi:3D (Asp-Asp-Asp) domain-containing protein